MKQITQNDMTVSWKIEAEHLYVSIRAPTAGWVAIGFNTTDQLAGTNLIMAAVTNAEVSISDRYIVAAGDHRPVTDFGAAAVAAVLSGTESAGWTEVNMTIPVAAADKYHLDLAPDTSIYLLMAFSREDDFAHHSMMRTSVKISL